MRSQKTYSSKKFNKSIIALSIGFAISGHAMAQPSGMSVMHGQAAMETLNNLTTITNSPGTILNWQQFNVGSGEVLKFIQDNAASQVFNRVTGGAASTILGTLQSNGQVFLINPGGVIIGQNAVINTAGFLASTLAISDKDLLAGKFAFNNDGKAQAITQAGSITAHSGGSVVLIAPNIENSGIIHADGDVLLAAGHSVTIVDLKHPTLGLTIDVAEGESAVNLSEIVGKNVSVFSSLVKNHGVVEANAAELGEGGVIRFRGSNGVELGQASRVDASGSTGGVVDVQSATGDALIAGAVRADGHERGGGDIQITGNRVAILRDAQVTANGQTAGGVVHVGGGWQGKDADLPNSTETVMQTGALLSANALGAGQGGEVVVWSDGLTTVAGALQAKGGLLGGDGGRIETSGKSHLKLSTPSVDTSAAQGVAGKWLLDPGNVRVVQGASETQSPIITPPDSGISPALFSSAGSTPDSSGDTFINNTDITDAFITNNTVEIRATKVVDANGDVVAPGNISIEAPILIGTDLSATTPTPQPANLSLWADGSVLINAYVGLTDFYSPPLQDPNTTSPSQPAQLLSLQNQFNSLSIDVFYGASSGANLIVSERLYTPYGTLTVRDINQVTNSTTMALENQLADLRIDANGDVIVNVLNAGSVTGFFDGGKLGIEGISAVSSIDISYIRLGSSAELTVANLNADTIEGISFLRPTEGRNLSVLNVTDGSINAIKGVYDLNVSGTFFASEAYLGNSLTVGMGANAYIFSLASSAVSTISIADGSPSQILSFAPFSDASLLNFLTVEPDANLFVGSFAARDVVLDGAIYQFGTEGGSSSYPGPFSSIGFSFLSDSIGGFLNNGTLVTTTGTGSLNIFSGEIKLGLSGFLDPSQNDNLFFDALDLPTINLESNSLLTLAGVVPISIFEKIAYVPGIVETTFESAANSLTNIALPVPPQQLSGNIGLHGVLDLQERTGAQTQQVLNEFALISLDLVTIANGVLGDGSLNGPGIFTTPGNAFYLKNVGLRSMATVIGDPIPSVTPENSNGTALILSADSYLNGAVIKLSNRAMLIQEAALDTPNDAKLGILPNGIGGVGTILVSGLNNLIAGGEYEFLPSTSTVLPPTNLIIGSGIEIQVDSSAYDANLTIPVLSFGQIDSEFALRIDDTAGTHMPSTPNTYEFGAPQCPCVRVHDSQSLNFQGTLLVPINPEVIPNINLSQDLGYVLFPSSPQIGSSSIQSIQAAEFLIAGGADFASAPTIDLGTLSKSKPGRKLKIAPNTFVNLTSGTGGVNLNSNFAADGNVSLVGNFNFAGGVSSTGSFNISNANVKLGGNSTFAQNVTAAGGAFEIAGTATFSGGFSATGTQLNLGLSNSPSTINGAVTLGAGTVVKGFATVIGDVSAGTGSTIAVGASPGLMTVVGNFELQAGSTLVVEVADTNGAPGVGYDYIRVNNVEGPGDGTGNAILNGTISLVDSSPGNLAVNVPVSFIEAETISGNPTYSYSPASTAYQFSQPTVVTITDPNSQTTRQLKQFTVQSSSTSTPPSTGSTTPTPTSAPTTAPTTAPTASPTPAPTASPTPAPTQAPTQSPTAPPPTQAPSQPPPTQQPTQLPPKSTTDVNQQLEVVYSETNTTQTKPLASQPPPPPPSDAPPPPPPEDGAPPPPRDGSAPPPPPDGNQPPPPPPKDPEEEKEAEELAKQSLNKPPISSQSKNIEVGTRPRPGPRPAAQCN